MHRDLPQIGPRNSRTTRGRLTGLLNGVVVGMLAISLAFSATLARADELDDEKERLNVQISQSKQDLHDYNQEASKAAAALQASEKALTEADSELTAAEAAERTARAKDKVAAAALKTAQDKLAKARKEADKAEADVKKWMKTVGRVVIQGQQQRTDILGLAVLTTDTRMSSLNQRAQWTRSMQDSTQRKLDQLRELKLKREAAEEAAEKLEADLSKKRAEAKQALTAAKKARTTLQEARDAQAEAVVQNEAAKIVADEQVAAEKKRQSQLQSESRDVEKRIQDRIAAEKAAAKKAAEEAAAKKKAEEAARAKAKAEAEAAQKRLEAARLAAKKASAAKKAAAQARAAALEKEAADKRRAAALEDAKATARTKAEIDAKRKAEIPKSNGLIYPSGAVITSPYGMRFHPILKYWKLHDGTDFGAACGTPIRSAADGKVTERYYNAGYGNRLLIDHGLFNGKYLTTAYNHATHYIVSPGQRVRQGQVVGYVGSTGYSTGCHLHYMTYVNGKLVDPMSLYN